MLNSSKNFSSVFKVLYSLGQFAVINPVHAKEFDKDLAGHLEQSFERLNFSTILWFNEQSFSKTLDAVDLGLLSTEDLSKSFKA